MPAAGPCFTPGVADVKRLFVADTSLFPTSLGGPPMITTAALATRLAERLVEKRAAYF